LGLLGLSVRRDFEIGLCQLRDIEACTQSCSEQEGTGKLAVYDGCLGGSRSAKSKIEGEVQRLSSNTRRKVGLRDSFVRSHAQLQLHAKYHREDDEQVHPSLPGKSSSPMAD